MKRSYLKRVKPNFPDAYYAGCDHNGIPTFKPYGHPRLAPVTPRQSKAILADIPLDQTEGCTFTLVKLTAPQLASFPA